MGSHRAGLLLIMAHTVREMSDEEIDPGFMRRITKLAMGDLAMNKVLLSTSSYWEALKRHIEASGNNDCLIAA